MTVYFIGNDFKQKASATSSSKIARITDDTIKQSVDGLSSCELEIAYTGNADDLGRVGEFIFIPAENRKDANFFQIITREVDYINKRVRYYADTDFLWFSSQNVNDGQFGRVSQVGASILWYLDEFTTSSSPFSFHVGDYELAGRLKAGDTNASSAKEAINKTAALFNAEITFSYVFDGGTVTPYINIYESGSGSNNSETLTVGKEIAELIESTDCANVATAVRIRGLVKSKKEYANGSEMTADTELYVEDVCITAGVPYKVYDYRVVSNSRMMTDPDTVYKYNNVYYIGKRSGTNQVQAVGWLVDDGFAVNLNAMFGATVDDDKNVVTELPAYDSGDYFVANKRLFSRSAGARFGAPEYGKRQNAYFASDIILQPENLETTDPQQLLDAGIALLDAQKEPAVTFSCKCTRRVTLGNYYTIVVPDEKLFISARCLEIEYSETRGEFTPTFGNYFATSNAFEIMAKNAK